jgi:hypothetical protein
VSGIWMLIVGWMILIVIVLLRSDCKMTDLGISSLSI